MTNPADNRNLAAAVERAQDVEGFEAWLAGHGMAWQPLSRGEYGVSLDEALLVWISEDPVLWCRAFLNEPGTEDPYEFWPYQVESVRSWRQDVIHQDGAEVGKTREIVALVLWSQCTAVGGTMRRPWILVGAPQQTHLDEIILEVEEHMGVADDTGGRRPFIGHFWRRPKRTPHTMQRFVTPNPDGGRPNPGRVYYRPAGHDGEAFRGVHVNAFGLFDEAAKIKNAVIWSEFFRALKPECRHRIYSVPDGDRTSQFYRMCRQAVPALPEGKPGLRLFHWSKQLMPPPFWSEERRQHFVRMYGGEDSPGYQRNVLGLHGQQEDTVFPWSLLAPNFRDVPEYTAVKLRADADAGTLTVEAYRVALRRAEGKRYGERRLLAEREDDLRDYPAKDRGRLRPALYELLREFIDPAPPGVYWVGADLGYAKDPTELFVYREIGEELRLLARVSCRGVGYDVQCELVYALDRLLGFQPAWGVDFGSAGTMVVHVLQNDEDFADANYEDRMTGYLFGASVDCVDESGEVLEEEDPKTGAVRVQRQQAKQWATDLILRRMQRAGYAMAMDDDLVGDLSNHTARAGARNLIYSKDGDHTIDAKRAAMLAKVYHGHGYGEDLFASGAVERRA